MGAAVVASLTGCVGAPALAVYGDLSERCFETRMTDDGVSALVGVTVTNETPRTVIVREAHVLGLQNARVDDIAVVPMPNAFSVFGDAPGGYLTLEQHHLWATRSAVEGAVIEGGRTVEVVVDLHADDRTRYAGLRGLRLKYDDGWFSATTTGDATIGFVPPRSHCGTRAG